MKNINDTLNNLHKSFEYTKMRQRTELLFKTMI